MMRSVRGSQRSIGTRSHRPRRAPLVGTHGQTRFSRSLVPCAQSADVDVSNKKSSSAGKQKIYVGKGRYIEDDPKKYPDRNALTGGFAGGEVGRNAVH